VSPCFVRVTLRDPIKGNVKVIYKNMNRISTITPAESGCDLWDSGKCTRIEETIDDLMKQM